MAHEYNNAIVSTTEAATKSEKGSDYFKLAQIYTERQEWSQALEFSNKSLSVGDLKAPYQALIIKGLAQYNLDRLEYAATTFFQPPFFNHLFSSSAFPRSGKNSTSVARIH